MKNQGERLLIMKVIFVPITVNNDTLQRKLLFMKD